MFRVEDLETSVKKLVRQEMMQEFDDALMERRLSASDDSLRQVMTWNRERFFKFFASRKRCGLE